MIGLWGRGYAVTTSTQSAVNDAGNDLQSRYNILYWRQLHDNLVRARQPKTYNEAEVIEIIRLVSELLLFGEAHGNDQMFEFFGHKNLLLTFCHMAREPRPAVQTQVIQSLTLLLFNVRRDEVLHYLLSNNYLNDLIFFDIDLDAEEIRDPYVNLLRTIAMRITPGTAPLFLDHRKAGPRGGVAHCPLFKRALEFLAHSDRLVRTAARTVTLSLYKVEEQDMRRFLTSEPCKRALFREVASGLKRHCNGLFVHLKAFTLKKRSAVENDLMDIQDELCFVQDLFEIGIRSLNEPLSIFVMEQFIQGVLVPAILATRQDLSYEPSTGDRYTTPEEGAEAEREGSDTAVPTASLTEEERGDREWSPNTADLYMFKQVALFILAQVYTFLHHPCLTRMLTLILLHPHDLHLIERVRNPALLLPPSSSSSSPTANQRATKRKKEGGSRSPSPPPSSSSSPLPSPISLREGTVAAKEGKAKGEEEVGNGEEDAGGEGEEEGVNVEPNLLRKMLLDCLTPGQHDGLTLVAALLFYRLLKNQGLKRGRRRLLRSLGFCHKSRRKRRQQQPSSIPSPSYPFLAPTTPSGSPTKNLSEGVAEKDEGRGEEEGKGEEQKSGSASKGRGLDDLLQRHHGGDKENKERSGSSIRQALFDGVDEWEENAEEFEEGEDEDEEEGEAEEQQRHERETNIDDNEEDETVINVLGYRIHNQVSLRARRGSLRTGMVLVNQKEVQGADQEVARHALSTLGLASERRIMTLRVLVALVMELLGLTPPVLLQEREEGEEGGKDGGRGGSLVMMVKEAYQASSIALLDKLLSDQGDLLLSSFEEVVIDTFLLPTSKNKRETGRPSSAPPSRRFSATAGAGSLLLPAAAMRERRVRRRSSATSAAANGGSSTAIAATYPPVSTKGTTGGVDTIVNNAQVIWSSWSPRLLPADVLTLLPKEYRLPWTSQEKLHCRLHAFFSIRTLYHLAGYLPITSLPPSIEGKGNDKQQSEGEGVMEKGQRDNDAEEEDDDVDAILLELAGLTIEPKLKIISEGEGEGSTSSTTTSNHEAEEALLIDMSDMDYLSCRLPTDWIPSSSSASSSSSSSGTIKQHHHHHQLAALRNYTSGSRTPSSRRSSSSSKTPTNSKEGGRRPRSASFDSSNSSSTTTTITNPLQEIAAASSFHSPVLPSTTLATTTSITTTATTIPLPSTTLTTITNNDSTTTTASSSTGLSFLSTITNAVGAGVGAVTSSAHAAGLSLSSSSASKSATPTNEKTSSTLSSLTHPPPPPAIGTPKAKKGEGLHTPTSSFASKEEGQLYYILHDELCLIARPDRTRLNVGRVVCALPIHQVEVVIDRHEPQRIKIITLTTSSLTEDDLQLNAPHLFQPFPPSPPPPSSSSSSPARATTSTPPPPPSTTSSLRLPPPYPPSPPPPISTTTPDNIPSIPASYLPTQQWYLVLEFDNDVNAVAVKEKVDSAGLKIRRERRASLQIFLQDIIETSSVDDEDDGNDDQEEFLAISNQISSTTADSTTTHPASGLAPPNQGVKATFSLQQGSSAAMIMMKRTQKQTKNRCDTEEECAMSDGADEEEEQEEAT